MCVTMKTIIYVYIYKSEHVSLLFHNHDYIYFFNLNLMNKVKISTRRGNVITDKT
jgi:hypothetical protein